MIARVLVLTFWILLVAVPSASASTSPFGFGRHEVTVSETAHVRANADVALIRIGCDVTRPAVVDVTRDARQRIEAVTAALTSAGVRPSDITTLVYSIDAAAATGTEGQSGFRVIHLLQVKVRDFHRVPSLVEAAVDAGANTTRGVEYTLEDPANSIAHAQGIAIARAQARARETAAGAGLYFDRIVGVTGDLRQVTSSPALGAQPREVSVAVTVTVRYGVYRFSPFGRVVPPLF